MINPIRGVFRVLFGFMALVLSLIVWGFAQLGVAGSTGQYAGSLGFWQFIGLIAALCAWLLPPYIWIIDPIIGHFRRRHQPGPKPLVWYGSAGPKGR